MMRRRLGLVLMLAGGYAIWMKRKLIGGVLKSEPTTTSIDSLIYYMENGPTKYAFVNDPGELDQAERQEWINALHATKTYLRAMGWPDGEPVNYLLDSFWPRLERVMIVETDMGIKIDRNASMKS